MTLIEILVVVSIIVVLIGLAVTGYSTAMQAGDARHTRVALQQAMLALTEYTATTTRQIEYTGPTPATDEYQSIREFTEGVQRVPVAKAALLTIDDKMLIDNNANPNTNNGADPNYIVDAWGTPLQYRLFHNGTKFITTDGNPGDNILPPLAGSGGGKYEYPQRGTATNPQPFFASAGPDKKFGTEDDLYSFDIE